MKLQIMRIASFLILVSFALESNAAQQHQQAGHSMIMPTELKWMDGPPSLPPGGQYAILEGDLSQPGPFTARFRFPANYRIPPHWHPAVEHVTVLEGSFSMGLGETFDESKAQKLPVGGFAIMQVGTRHFAFTKEAAIIQLHGIGPWGINYVNPTDDPRNKARAP